MGTNLEEYLKEVQSTLIDLISLERSLNEKILAQQGSSSIATYLDKLADSKLLLQSNIKKLYDIKKEQAQGATHTYSIIRTMGESIKKETADVKKIMNEFKDVINNKKRMNEITDYEKKKYESYRDLLKYIVYASITIIILTFLSNSSWFPSMFAKALIIIVITYTLYAISGEIFWNFRREDKYWDKFRQDAAFDYNEETGQIGLSRWEHNRKALAKLFGTDISLPGGCIVESSDGTKYTGTDYSCKITVAGANQLVNKVQDQQKSNLGDVVQSR